MTVKFRVTEVLEGKSSTHPYYPLLPGDILMRDVDGCWMKHAPGLAIGGFRLSKEDEATLEAADEAHWVLV